MNLIKSIWPTPFKIKKGDLVSFIVQLIIFIVICAVIGWLFGVLANIPIVGLIFKVIGGLMGIYSFVGIILCILVFLGLTK